jgi:hypothetical protein
MQKKDDQDLSIERRHEILMRSWRLRSFTTSRRLKHAT